MTDATVQGPVALPASASRPSRHSPTKRPTSFVSASLQVAFAASMKQRECISSAGSVTQGKSQRSNASLAVSSKASMAFPRPSVGTMRPRWACASERPLDDSNWVAEMLEMYHGDQYDSRDPGQRD